MGIVSFPANLKGRDLNAIARHAWVQACADPQLAVLLLRRWTDLGLCEAVELIQKTAYQVGDGFKVSIVSIADLPAEIAEALAPRSIAERRAAQPAAHRAARGVRKVRGAK
jgi:hypothetical protein